VSSTTTFEPAENEELPSVLIVDDLQANLLALEVVLEGLDCRVVSAVSGDQALLSVLRQDFAVILLDVHMPTMDGYEVAAHLRSRSASRETPIIFLTAHDDEEHVLRAYGSGAVDFLSKPIKHEVLRGKVRVFLELYRSRRALGAANRLLESKNTELQALAEAEANVSRSLRQANSELKQAYRDLQSVQGQLVQSAKMASLGALVAGVAHEINSPLAFVQSHIGTAQRCLDEFRAGLREAVPDTLDEPWRKARSRLSETAVGLSRIGDLVLKLRSFSRLDEGERKAIPFKECLDSVLTILGHRLHGRIEVQARISPPEVVECYPALLNQVLLNLVGNAADAIDGSGTISITAGGDGADYVISVHDSGPGIPLELRDRVLEPFFTTKPVGVGTGLGLSIAYSIVQKHRGSLTLDNSPAGGAIATIRFPLSPE
jgi:two-component system, NtrC family, sensor kinase